MCVFLHVAYERRERRFGSGSSMHQEGARPTKTDRKEPLNVLHGRMEVSFKSTADISLRGLHGTSSDRVQIFLYLLLTSYTVDIPE